MEKIMKWFLGLLLMPLVSAQEYNCPMGYGMMSGAYGVVWAALGWVLGILVIVALVLFIIWIVRQLQK